MRRSLVALVALAVLVPGHAPAAPTEFKATLQNKWDPSKQRVPKGTKVVFSNPVEQPHDLKPYKGPWPNKKGVWLYQGDTVSYKLTAKGKYLFRCLLHSEVSDGVCDGMCGSITTH